MVFLKKSTFSSSVVLSKESQKETFFDQLDSKECFLDLKSEDEKNRHFAKGFNPWFLSKNWPFSHMLFLSKKKGRKNYFLIFWIEKNAFQTWKVKFLKSRKNRHFAKGLVHGFSEKIDLFLICSFEQRKPNRNNFWYSG